MIFKIPSFPCSSCILITWCIAEDWKPTCTEWIYGYSRTRTGQRALLGCLHAWSREKKKEKKNVNAYLLVFFFKKKKSSSWYFQHVYNQSNGLMSWVCLFMLSCTMSIWIFKSLGIKAYSNMVILTNLSSWFEDTICPYIDSVDKLNQMLFFFELYYCDTLLLGSIQKYKAESINKNIQKSAEIFMNKFRITKKLNLLAMQFLDFT